MHLEGFQSSSHIRSKCSHICSECSCSRYDIVTYRLHRIHKTCELGRQLPVTENITIQLGRGSITGILTGPSIVNVCFAFLGSR
jgi:hypothetical protein